MEFDANVTDGVEKMRATTILVEIVGLHQCTKNLLKNVHTNSKYRPLVVIQASDTQELFSISAKDKVWFDKTLLHLSGGKYENKVTMAQYLSNYLFEKYDDEAIFDPSQCGFPISTSMKL